MAETQELTREQQLIEEFKAGLEPDAAPQLAKRIADLEAALTEQSARADKAEKAAKSARAKVQAAEPPAKPRRLAAGDDRVDDLAAAIADADRVEIAFSDGVREIDGADPVVVEGEAWRATPNGLMLTEAVTLHGRAAQQAAYAVEGYALLLDGKQVAYRKRPDPITVVPGQQVKIVDDIIF